MNHPYPALLIAHYKILDSQTPPVAIHILIVNHPASLLLIVSSYGMLYHTHLLTFPFPPAHASNDCNRLLFFLFFSSILFAGRKTSRDCLELSEISTDIELYGNQLKICLPNTPILEGLSIHEINNEVVILFATVGSVHRLTFSHPKSSRMILGKLNDRVSSASIFNNFSADSLRDPANYRVLSSSFGLSSTSTLTSGINFPISSCSWLTSDGDATFVLSSSSGCLWVLRMGINGDAGASWELRQAGLMDRLKGFVPSIIRSSNEVDETALSILSHAFLTDTLIFTLCRDLKIRIWSHSKRKLLHIIELGNIDESVTSSNVSIRKPIMRKSESESGLNLVVHTNDLLRKKSFLVYRVTLTGNRVDLLHLTTLHTGTDDDLIDLKVVKDELYYLSSDSPQRYTVNYASLRQ